MAVFGSDQIRCSLVQVDNSNNSWINPTQYVLNRLDGTLVDEIEIGQIPWPHHWPEEKKDFSWSFIDFTPDMGAKVQRTALQEAFNSVEKLTGLTLTYEQESASKTDITVEWLEDSQKFDSRLSVLAHAYLFAPNSKYNGVMEFNDSPESRWHFTPLGWPVPAYLVDPKNFKEGDVDSMGHLLMRASQPTVQIGMHELGHILFGRHDVLNWNSLMYPTVKRGWRDGRVIPESFIWDNVTSIPRMHELFGSSNIPERHLQRWDERRLRASTYTRHA